MQILPVQGLIPLTLMQVEVLRGWRHAKSWETLFDTNKVHSHPHIIQAGQFISHWKAFSHVLALFSVVWERYKSLQKLFKSNTLIILQEHWKHFKFVIEFITHWNLFFFMINLYKLDIQMILFYIIIFKILITKLWTVELDKYMDGRIWQKYGWHCGENMGGKNNNEIWTEEVWTPLFLKHCGIQHFKNRLLPVLKLLQNVPRHSLFKLCKFHEKINGQFSARGQNVL